jgi:hypothetical protein
MNKPLSNSILGLAAAAVISSIGLGATAAPAQADQASTAAIIAGLGAIAGTLIYDANRHQYYYNRGGRHVYVDNNTSNAYYQRHPNMHRDSRDPMAHNSGHGGHSGHMGH